MSTLTMERIREYGLITEFGGAVPCPTVDILPHVDVDALTAGDDDPFYVTLQISEVGRISKNNVEYDDYLVSTIEESIRNGGIEGLMGHLSTDALDTEFPHSDESPTPLAGFWVGVKRVGEILWGKAYIPPGKVREYFRQKKATNGKVGVSIFGRARVVVEDGIRRFRDFVLETLDFAPHNRASLELAGDFDVTREFETENSDEEGEMPTEITLQDVPQHVREQIRQEALRDTQATENAERVQELEQQLQEQAQTVTEMREYGRIVTEISAFLPEDADLVALVREMNETQMRLVEILGESVSIVTRIEELHTSVSEMEQERFTNAITAQVAELTNWNISGDKAESKLDALRKNFQAQVVSQMGSDQSVERVAEVAQQVWDDSYQVIAEAVRDSLAGPGAFVGGKSKPSDFKEQMKSPEAQADLKSKYGIR